MLRVLIVDNNVELCETLEEFIAAQPDMEVVGSAYDGVEALDHISKLQPDVIILDITMPRLDGLAVLEHLTDLALPSQPRVIVLTALGREDVVERCTNLGATYFIVKPFDFELLAERIRQFAQAPPRSAAARVASERSIPHRHLEVAVTDLLHEMGVPVHFKGYTYLREAVLMVLGDEDLQAATLSKELYPRLADKYGATASGVEAAIRNAVIASWENGNRDFVEKLTGSGARVRKGKFPTNSMIIAKLVDRLRLQMKAG